MENKKKAISEIDKIVSALCELETLCENSFELCDMISTAYPFEKCIEETILDVISWEDAIETEENEND